MWNGRTVSVVIGTYREKRSIRGVVDGFYATGVVDEVLVVNNNAEPGTTEEVGQTSARQVFESHQGYGRAYQRGSSRGRGGTSLSSPKRMAPSSPNDILKLLVYSDDCDAVFGTRTTRELIWRGANMGWFLKWGQLGRRQTRRSPLQHEPSQ